MKYLHMIQITKHEITNLHPHIAQNNIILIKIVFLNLFFLSKMNPSNELLQVNSETYINDKRNV